MDIWQVKYVRIGDLIPNAKNPRKISKEKLERLQDKIQCLGFHNPVKTDENLNVLGGNQRLKALLKIAGKDLEIPVMYPTRPLTQAEKDEIVITDNISDGEWDWDILTADWDKALTTSWGLDWGEVETAAEETPQELSEKYTLKITTPIYEVKGDKPDISELVDVVKTNAIIDEINAADGIPEEVKGFLRIAAARQLGFKYFLELDDDYIHFRFTLDKFKNYTVQMCKNLDEVFNIFLTYFKSIPAKSIAMAQGGDILGGGKSKTLRNGKIKRKAMNTFFCSVDRPFQFVGRINEDVNTYVSLGAVGEIFMTLTNICITQNQTQKTKGGMTEVYLNSGTYLKSFYSVMFAPSAVQIAVMGDKEKRIHHRVNWKFAAPLIIRESLKK